jgi:hypothetical protein
MLVYVGAFVMDNVLHYQQHLLAVAMASWPSGLSRRGQTPSKLAARLSPYRALWQAGCECCAGDGAVIASRSCGNTSHSGILGGEALDSGG